MKRSFRILFALAVLSMLGASPQDNVTFVVGHSSTFEMLDNVEVLLAVGSTLIPLGRTSPLGQLTIRKDKLRQDNSGVVLFCKEHFFCGALRLDEPNFFKFDRHLIHLAPFAVE